MNKPEFVKVKPKNRRAKNRVRDHGDIMILKDQKPGEFLVESRRETFRVKGVAMKWTGWFKHDEAEIVKV